MISSIKKIHQTSIFIFRRDLRIDDNIGLLQSLKQSEQVIPCFILDRHQLNQKENAYFSNNCVQFMVESLKDLNKQLEYKNSRLFLFEGNISDVIQNIIKEAKPQAIFVNEDVTPYSIKRDTQISNICKENSVRFYSFSDLTLVQKDKALLADKTFSKIFTPFYKIAQKIPIEEPKNLSLNNFVPANTKFSIDYDINELNKFYKENPNIEVHGGREAGLKILSDIKKFKDYKNTRDILNLSTTKLSAYNKFGTMSIREVYYAMKRAFGPDHKLIEQLYWRDFYYHICYHYPHVIGSTLVPQFANVVWWQKNDLFYERWKEGKTGCPIVDAAMRHMNTTGYLSNRLRMVVANYLVKDLLVDWKLGEKYFANQLVDIDPSQNNGGWQWVAGCGTDSHQPYLRIFNPRLQSEKFDPDCKYIYKWIPELKGVKPAHIHGWEDHHFDYKDIDYPAPLVYHNKQKAKYTRIFKQAMEGIDLGEDYEESKREEEPSNFKKKDKREYEDKPESHKNYKKNNNGNYGKNSDEYYGESRGGYVQVFQKKN